MDCSHPRLIRGIDRSVCPDCGARIARPDPATCPHPVEAHNRIEGIGGAWILTCTECGGVLAKKRADP